MDKLPHPDKRGVVVFVWRNSSTLTADIALVTLVHSSLKLVVLDDLRRAQVLQQNMQLSQSDPAAAEAFSSSGAARDGAKVKWKSVCLHDAI